MEMIINQDNRQVVKKGIGQVVIWSCPIVPRTGALSRLIFSYEMGTILALIKAV
jgi:hypothetical protein